MVNGSVRARGMRGRNAGVGRRRTAVLLVAVTALGTLGVWRAQAPAAAHETKAVVPMTCSIGGRLTATYTVTHTPVPGAVAGQPFIVDLGTSLAIDQSNPTVGVASLRISIPSPPGLVWNEIQADGGTFTKTSQTVEGGLLTIGLTANPGTNIKTMVVPRLLLPTDIPASMAGETLTLSAPTKLVFGILLSPPPIDATCTADGAVPPLLKTVVAPGGGPGTTSPTVTRTRPGTGPVPTRPPGSTPGSTSTSTPGSTSTTVADGDDDGTAPVAEPVSGTPAYAG